MIGCLLRRWDDLETIVAVGDGSSGGRSSLEFD